MFDRLPYEVLENTAFWLAYDYNGSLYPLSPFLLTTRIVHDRLLGAPTRGLPANHALFTRLFVEHFNWQAFERRWRIALTSADLAAEYKKRVGVLRRIKIHRNEPTIEDLWTVLLMIYEDDGNNMLQLLDAGVEEWVYHPATSFSLDEGGWPVESEALRLSFAIISLVGSVERVEHETPETRKRLTNIFEHFISAPHQYPISHFPITRYSRFQQVFLPEDGVTEHAIAPIIQSETRDVEHFGRILRLASPPAAESAHCAYYLRQERVDVPIPSDAPKTRAEADARNLGATVIDHQENLYHRKQALGSETPHAGSKRERKNLPCLPNPLRKSERFDIDYWRLCSVGWTLERSFDIPRCWFNTLYNPGILTGKWYGRMSIPDWGAFRQVLAMHPASPSVGKLYPGVIQVMQLFLREHVTTDELQTVGYGDVRNGWFPKGINPSLGRRAVETSAGLRFDDPNEPIDDWREKRYQLYDEGMQVPKCEMPPYLETIAKVPENVERDFEEANNRHPDRINEDGSGSEDDFPYLDVCIMGETGYHYGFAWGAFKVYGRVRKHDGMLVLVRVPSTPQVGQGRWIFCGYLRASATIVGQWRLTSEEDYVVPYAGTFMLTKVGESWGPPPL